MENIKKFSREYGHGRANYINGPRVAGARSLPAKSDQVISNAEATAASQRAPGPGHKHQAPSSKRQASSTESVKLQATSVKPQA